MTNPVVVDDGALERIPNLDLASLKFTYSQVDTTNTTEVHSLKAEMITLIEKDFMAPFYKHLCEDLKWWPLDQSLFSKLDKKNQETLKEWDDKREDAEKNLGDTEVMDALIGKANYYCRIGDKVVKRLLTIGVLICYTFCRLTLFQLSR